jgi:hypothetical protein
VSAGRASSAESSRETSREPRESPARASIEAAGIPNPSVPIAPPPRTPRRHAANANTVRQTRLDERFDRYDAEGAYAGDRLPAAEADIFESAIDPLAVVLASSGSLFALSPPGVPEARDRRDAHRRTRRGKQRRARPTPQVQPRLFDRSSTK